MKPVATAGVAGIVETNQLGESMDADARNAQLDTEPSADERMRQMVADPVAYFTQARVDAKIEAKRYVAKRLGRRAKTA